ncbi:hypothetical protein K435DRAFT_865353 [Dendrothele bispora CBS 962.96]|uniref:Uncharacterized protein n=1 Tax=Dendrothele bispora (strain CBS 962.96) TaxID=1314807 RepID=A0A4S8LJU4_DENBC|nr:hypothetical protein K435DRAFT_865353 [Dendrothele bispora CBS 962.96]
MGRWTQYDEDEYRLPPGVRRTGYDADTGQYHFSGGGKSAPYSRYRESQGEVQTSPEDEFHPMDAIIQAATRVADRVIPPLQDMAQDARNVVVGLPEEVMRLARSATLPSRPTTTGHKLSYEGTKNLSRSATVGESKDSQSSSLERSLFAPSGKPLSRSVSLPVPGSAQVAEKRATAPRASSPRLASKGEASSNPSFGREREIAQERRRASDNAGAE